MFIATRLRDGSTVYRSRINGTRWTISPNGYLYRDGHPISLGYEPERSATLAVIERCAAKAS